MNRKELFADDLQPTQSSLLVRLRDWEDEESWRRFFDTYWKLLYCVAVKAGLTDAEARDVVQETVIGVAKNMRDGRFKRQPGSFRSWLLTILYRRINDHFRKRRLPVHPERSESNESVTPVIERLAAPTSADVEEIWETEWAAKVADAAIEQVKQRVSARQFQMFDLYGVKGCSVLEVARLLRVNVAQVYLAKYRITSLIKKEVRKIEAEANVWPESLPGEKQRL
jgi:RNA polymerase sigma factor (sigma-70 family)